MGRKFHIDEFIAMQQRKASLIVGRHTLATTIEAIIGASYLDGGMPAVRDVMRNLDLDSPNLLPPDNIRGRVLKRFRRVRRSLMTASLQAGRFWDSMLRKSGFAKRSEN